MKDLLQQLAAINDTAQKMRPQDLAKTLFRLASDFDEVEWKTAAVEKANVKVDAFFKKHSKRFVELVNTYRDDDAEALLQQLRDDFWSDL